MLALLIAFCLAVFPCHARASSAFQHQVSTVHEQWCLHDIVQAERECQQSLDWQVRSTGDGLADLGVWIGRLLTADRWTNKIAYCDLALDITGSERDLHARVIPVSAHTRVSLLADAWKPWSLRLYLDADVVPGAATQADDTIYRALAAHADASLCVIVDRRT